MRNNPLITTAATPAKSGLNESHVTASQRETVDYGHRNGPNLLYDQLITTAVLTGHFKARGLPNDMYLVLCDGQNMKMLVKSRTCTLHSTLLL